MVKGRNGNLNINPMVRDLEALRQNGMVVDNISEESSSSD